MKGLCDSLQMCVVLSFYMCTLFDKGMQGLLGGWREYLFDCLGTVGKHVIVTR